MVEKGALDLITSTALVTLVASGGSEGKVLMVKFHVIKAVGLHTLTASVNSWLQSLPEQFEIVSHSTVPSGESMIFSCIYRVRGS